MVGPLQFLRCALGEGHGLPRNIALNMHMAHMANWVQLFIGCFWPKVLFSGPVGGKQHFWPETVDTWLDPYKIFELRA